VLSHADIRIGLSQSVHRINANINEGLVRLASGLSMDYARSLDFIEQCVTELSAMLDELQELQQAARDVILRDGALCEISLFDEIGRQFQELPKRCLEFVQFVEDAASSPRPRLVGGPRNWWRYNKLLRQTSRLRQEFEQIAGWAKRWPKSDPARIAAARESLAAGNGVDVKDILRELHAQN
jgi:hypothetical protein